MLKSLVIAVALGAVAVTGFTAVAQAHHKVGHCFPPGVVVAGCPVTPQGPQLPKPPGK
jgi:Ni,Fe-hydrogenase III small subunit